MRFEDLDGRLALGEVEEELPINDFRGHSKTGRGSSFSLVTLNSV